MYQGNLGIWVKGYPNFFIFIFFAKMIFVKFEIVNERTNDSIYIYIGITKRL